ncbi:GGDEF domain-containing protein [Jatrophihabitans sp.]|uniref:GGDEF domain-containing protein n=1 Tax=Jatrophihabitans sp. TaxID=1932789 RepID=UPI003F7D4877
MSAVPSLAEAGGFEATARAVLDYLNAHLPMGFWSITRLENDQQTYLYLDTNDYGLVSGGGHPWSDSYCRYMVSGDAPRLAPHAQEIAVYAQAPINRAVRIGAYAGAPISEPDGALFGAICGLDPLPQDDMQRFGPILDLLSNLLSIALATDRSLDAAERRASAELTRATPASLTGLHNRRGWDEALERLGRTYATYADPTVVAIVDLDGLKQVNDGPGGHAAGDELLRSAAQALRATVRDGDLVARLGGDEFGLVLAGTTAAAAPLLMHRLRWGLEDAGVAASLGWAALRPGGSVASAVITADEAMYSDKRSRNAQRPLRGLAQSV